MNKSQATYDAFRLETKSNHHQVNLEFVFFGIGFNFKSVMWIGNRRDTECNINLW